MSVIFKKHIPRRTFLRGMGVAVSLPLLDSMVPAQTPLAKTAANPRIRLGLCFIPHGAVMANWTPPAEGAGFDLSRTLAPLAPFRDQVNVISNLAHKMAAPGGPGDNGGDHTRSPAVYLSGVHPKRTDGADIQAGTTIDQIAAAKIGQDTPLPSLEIATEDFTGYVGGCSPGFSCAYLNTICWNTPATPLPMETNPRVVFERLFGVAGTAEQRAARAGREKSILDSVAEETSDLERGLGPRDRARLGDYLENVREIERRIQRAEAHNSTQVQTPDAPIGVPDSFEEHVGLMFDLVAAAFQADVTRVFTFMTSRELSQRTYPNIGVTEQHHSVSHHQNKPEKMAQVVKINTYYVRMYAKFLEKLRDTPDGDGSLLDHSLLIYGAGMGDSNVHASDPLPLIAVGGGAGRGPRHVVLPERTPVGSLWMNVAEKFGHPMDRYGDATKKVDVFA